MRYLFWFFVIILLSVSCDNKRNLELPQVATTTSIQMTDHSPVYIFFNQENETAELNRRNLITSTHWIFHIDKRNSLYEAGSQIDMMQTRKENPMSPHNNPNSRNYFSVANMSQKELGFIDFTDTRFLPFRTENLMEKVVGVTRIDVDSQNFYIKGQKIDIQDFNQEKDLLYVWVFDGKMSFQEFIEIYDKLLKINIIPKKIIYTK